MIPQSKEQWKKVKAALKLRTTESLKLAVIEANKVFMDFVGAKGVKMETSREVLNIIYHDIDAPEKLGLAIKFYEMIINGNSVDIKYDEVKKIISDYYQAMLNLEDLGSIRLIWIKQNYRRFLKTFKYLFREVKYVSLLILMFLVLIIVMSTTSFGSNLMSGIVKIANIVFFSFLPAIFIALAAVVMVVGTILYYSRKPKVNLEKFTIEEDDDEIEIKG